jgi:hypothetical protein
MLGLFFRRHATRFHNLANAQGRGSTRSDTSGLESKSEVIVQVVVPPNSQLVRFSFGDDLHLKALIQVVTASPPRHRSSLIVTPLTPAQPYNTKPTARKVGQSHFRMAINTYRTKDNLAQTSRMNQRPAV